MKRAVESGIVVLILIALGTAAAVWWFRGDLNQSATQSPQDRKTRVEPASTTGNPQRVQRITVSLGTLKHSAPAIVVPAQSVVDMSPTSWQEPFESGYWQAEGWSFDGDAMLCDDDARAEATFRRAYHRAMLEFRVQPIGAGGAFEIQLQDPQSDSVTAIEFGYPTDGQRAQDRQIIAWREIDPGLVAGTESHVRVNATGNRIVVFLDGRRVLNCDQPSRQSGHPLYLSFVARSFALGIRELRIEGE